MPSTRSDLLSLVIALVIPQVAGIVGNIFTMPAIPTWYRGLRKPPWNPPAWVFGPVWTLLYLMMGAASWVIWRVDWDRDDVKWSLGLFGGQLTMNTLWSVIFFGAKAPGLALAEIVVLWNLIAATMVRFYRIRPGAGLLMLPYLMWVTYATTLNAGIWWLNREGQE